MSRIDIDHITFAIDASPDDNHVTTSSDDLLGRVILLSECVTACLELHPRRKDKEILVFAHNFAISQSNAFHSSLGDEANHKVSSLTGHTDCFLSVFAPSQSAFCAHLREQKKAPP